MRKTLLAAAAAFVIGGASVGSFMSYAQPAPPPPGPDMEGPDGHHHHGPMAWMHHWREHGPIAPGTFALIYRQPDRNLSPADVQKIAEAFLLWNGNHTWKVVNVGPADNGAIKFSLATPEGSVVASFTMDPHTGRVTRTG